MGDWFLLDSNFEISLVGGLLLVVALVFGFQWNRRRRKPTLELRERPARQASFEAAPSRPTEAVAVGARASEVTEGVAKGGAPPERVPEAPAASRSVASVEAVQKSEPPPLFTALANTRSSFFGRLRGLFASDAPLPEADLENLEEILYTSDLGPKTVQRLMGAVESQLKSNKSYEFKTVREALKSEMLGIFQVVEGNPKDRAVHHGSETYIDGLDRLAIWGHKPAVIMVVGVNGAGKTTTIGKVARRLAQCGQRVLVAAGDTFRAAAGEQLRVWTERAQVEIFHRDGVADPSAVAHMATEEARKMGFDVVIVDTAGRLHTQKNLMEELKKMKRVINRQLPTAPHEVLLVLDANSGQNALVQAKEFHEALGVTGVALTKLDGTAKGGVAVGLACELELPIKLIGVGEGLDDLRRFSSHEFVDSII